MSKSQPNVDLPVGSVDCYIHGEPKLQRAIILFDSGAARSLISAKSLLLKSSKIRIEPATINLVGFDGSAVVSAGTVEINMVDIYGSKLSLQAAIVPNIPNFEVLVSWKTLKNFKTHASETRINLDSIKSNSMSFLFARSLHRVFFCAQEVVVPRYCSKNIQLIGYGGPINEPQIIEGLDHLENVEILPQFTDKCEDDIWVTMDNRSPDNLIIHTGTRLAIGEPAKEVELDLLQQVEFAKGKHKKLQPSNYFLSTFKRLKSSIFETLVLKTST